jgi:Na+-driven multidrug efflux pump
MEREREREREGGGESDEVKHTTKKKVANEVIIATTIAVLYAFCLHVCYKKILSLSSETAAAPAKAATYLYLLMLFFSPTFSSPLYCSFCRCSASTL